MARQRVTATRIYVMVDDPNKGRSLMEVLGTVRTSREYTLHGELESATVHLSGDILRQVMWDGRSPIPHDAPALDPALPAIDRRGDPIP